MQISAVLDELANDFFNCSVAKIQYEPQPGGYSWVSNMKLVCDNNSYLLRIMPIEQSRKSIKQELDITQYAASKGLSPEVFYRAPNDAYILMDYIEGRILDGNILSSTEILQQIHALFDVLHHDNVPIKGQARNLLDNAMSFIALLPEALRWADFLQPEVKAFNAFLLQESLKPQVLIHNDPNPHNFILDRNNNLWLIDWTDAGLGRIESDIAMVCLFVPSFDSTMHEPLRLYELLRLFCLFCWGLKEAQRRDINFKFYPSQLKRSYLEKPLDVFLSEVIDGDIVLRDAEDFLEFSMRVWAYYQQGLRYA